MERVEEGRGDQYADQAGFLLAREGGALLLLSQILTLRAAPQRQVQVALRSHILRIEWQETPA